MKELFIFLVVVFALHSTAHSKDIKLETSSLSITINGKGYVVSIFDKLNKKEYLPQAKKAPLMSIRVNSAIEAPSLLKQKGNRLILSYDKNKVEAEIAAVVKKDYISLELKTIIASEKVELVIWGPFPTTISETIGESVGVVHNKEFAFGIQALNVKTLGGYPTEENDIEPSYDIFETESLKDITPEWVNKKLYRGQTAKAEDFGSVLQAYCRNRNKERVIANWKHDFYVAPAFNDGGVSGTKIALFGTVPAKALATIGLIELQEGLPHPTINGQWAKTSPLATASYLIIGFNEDNLDRAIALTQKAGLKYLYHGGPFKTWGHFVLDEKSFPDNWESMKRCVDRASAKGIKLGVHTLSNFITTNDAYVSPIPDKRLAKVGESVLAKDMDEETDEISIESPQFFNQMENNSLHAVVIGNEIIRYKKVSESAPWKLIGCVRGAFNTQATAHRKGETIGKLMDHGYKVFLSDADLSAEIAKNIAALYNKTGLMQISFDGLEGVWSTGMGQYARSLFTKTWYDHLSPELKGKIINDASNPSHFNWHINTRYNWGEPWYAGFRESQTYYRLMNQDFYRRNLLPAMLGWFSMSDQTSIEDTEWLLARAAGFDAGFAFNVSFKNIEKNGQSDKILEAIKNWETARMAGAFSKEQKLQMKDIKNEYHLEEAKGAGEWNLYPYHIKHFVHEQKVRQPGEPLSSTFEFDNPYASQSLMFILKIDPDNGNTESSVSNIIMEVNHSSTLKIPVSMNPTQILKLDEKGVLQLFDKNWNLIKTMETGSNLPILSKGKNEINVDVEFAAPGSSKVKIEIKVKGPAELIEVGSAK